MDCPHCQSKNTKKLSQKTLLGYQQYRCSHCSRQFNERAGIPLNFIEYPTEVVMMTVYYYYRFKVSLDDVLELMLMRGFHLSHQTVPVNTTGILPDQITTDKEPALYPAIKAIFGDKTKHRDRKYMNNCIEQDHRGIKSRYQVMKGFKNPFSALIFAQCLKKYGNYFA